MDRNDALRIVIFEYLIPNQKKSRCNILHDIVQKNFTSIPKTQEQNLSGLMEHLLIISDAFMSSRGYPTSFILPYNRNNMYSMYGFRESLMVRALIIPPVDRIRVFERMADPPAGYRIFD